MTSSRKARSSSVTPPAYEPTQPGYVWPDAWSVGEMYALGKANPCGEWSMYDIWGGSREKMYCMLPNDHEYEYGMPHVSLHKNRAWRAGFSYDIWFKALDDLLDSPHRTNTAAKSELAHPTNLTDTVGTEEEV